MAKVPGAAQIGRGPSLRDPGVTAPAAAFDLGGGGLQQVSESLAVRADKFARIEKAENARKNAVGRARADRAFEERSTDLLRAYAQADDPTDPEARKAIQEGLDSLAADVTANHSKDPDSQAVLYSALQKKLAKFYAQAGTIAATHVRRAIGDQLTEARSTGVNAVTQDPGKLFDALQTYQERIALVANALTPTEESEALRQGTDVLTKAALTTMIRRGQHEQVKHLLTTDRELVEMMGEQTIIDLRTEIDAFDTEMRKVDLEYARGLHRARKLYGPNPTPEQVASAMGDDVPELELVEVVSDTGVTIRVPAREAIGMPVPRGKVKDPLIPVVGPDGTAVLKRESQAEGMTPAPTSTRAPVAVLTDDGRTIYVSPDEAIGMKVPPESSADPLVAVLNEDGGPEFVRASQAEGRTPADPGQVVPVVNADGTRTWQSRAGAVGQTAPEDSPLVEVGGDRESARDKAIGKKLGEAEADQLVTARDRGTQAQRDLVEIRRIKESLAGETFQTGSFAETRRAIAQFARLISPGAADIVEEIVGSAATADTIRAASKRLALNEVPNLGRTLKAGIQLIQDTLPDLSVTPEGNAILIEVLERVAQRQIEAAKLAETYWRLGTTLPPDAPSYDQALLALEAEDPIITDDLALRMRQGAKFGENIGRGAVLDESVHPELRAELTRLGLKTLPPHDGEYYDTKDRPVIKLPNGTWWTADGREKLTFEDEAND